MMSYSPSEELSVHYESKAFCGCCLCPLLGQQYILLRLET
jgi:hypothetical protein